MSVRGAESTICMHMYMYIRQDALTTYITQNNPFITARCVHSPWSLTRLTCGTYLIHWLVDWLVETNGQGCVCVRVCMYACVCMYVCVA